MPEWPENKLYAEWQATDPANRREVETRLYNSVKAHAQAVLWKTLNETPPELVV